MSQSFTVRIDESYTADIKHKGKWWIGSVNEIKGVNCQERTKDELLDSLHEALADMLTFDLIMSEFDIEDLL